ncbi:MAG: hypothetical protein J5J06_14085 [Phycisphaerae bacterium]|nr:hypothetical protein [Phycisphaerae bacterium]
MTSHETPPIGASSPSAGESRWPIAIVVFLAVFLVFLAVSRAQTLQARLACQQHMQALWEKLVTQCPDGPSGICFEEFVLMKHLSQADVSCPSCKGAPCQYVVPGFSVYPPPCGDVLIYERKSNHGGTGGNALFPDGHAEFLSEADYDRLFGCMRVPEVIGQSLDEE